MASTPEELERERVALAVTLAAQDRERAVQLAESRGREQGATQARLDDHQSHLAAINGSIERLAGGMLSLTSKFEGIERERIKRDAEAHARTKIVQDAATKQVTKTNLFFAGVMAVAAAVGAIEFLPKLFGG